MNGDVLSAVQAFAAIGTLLVGFSIAGVAIRWIYLKSTPRPLRSGDDAEQLRTALERLDENDRRVAELEERLDFAERLLAQQAGPARLPERNG
jgi:hypothetical protein